MGKIIRKVAAATIIALVLFIFATAIISAFSRPYNSSDKTQPPSGVVCTLNFNKTRFCKSILDYSNETLIDDAAKSYCPNILEPLDPLAEFVVAQGEYLSEVKNDPRAAKTWFAEFVPKSKWSLASNSQEDYVLDVLSNVNYVYNLGQYRVEEALIANSPEAMTLYKDDFIDFSPLTKSIEANCQSELNRGKEIEMQTIAWGGDIAVAWRAAKTAPWYPQGFIASGGKLAYKFVDGSCSPGTSCFLINVVAQNDCPSGVSGVASSYDSAETLLGEHKAKSPKLTNGNTVRIEFKVNRDARRLDITNLTCN